MGTSDPKRRSKMTSPEEDIAVVNRVQRYTFGTPVFFCSAKDEVEEIRPCTKAVIHRGDLIAFLVVYTFSPARSAEDGGWMV
ncbi:hypothetical protein BHE74_00023731 [Ensete ventricosum]|uniref:Uncharacterized protein n=1 Tax=Ensete ventricosum TaxID=4639 RepID=A0A444DEP4_ENSVE|nr:hypothetical protein B296_00027891 [Ensete ventricosum]RWV96589.1 hypothetical protein GW17_00040685 [Ensete ventricosum]RWW68733.1 hypothetical protein BHE74_00023731 [Ensete ventricosum]RZS02235.1 hypothetical protein BHM03_00032255 [Ensete ventricosum]